MNYIVLDLEWNQGQRHDKRDVPTFEIIEIGAVKLDEQFRVVDTFQRLIKPRIYNTMHKITAELVNLDMRDLKGEEHFTKVAKEFLRWCGEDYIFCIWGVQDLTEFQKNMDYYRMEPLSKGPLKYYDIQKLYGLACEDGKARHSLSHVVEGECLLDEEMEFHRALGDAYYTALVFCKIQSDELLERVSFDTYRIPENKKEQVFWKFDNYTKLISEGYDGKSKLMSDKTITCVRCIYCDKALRKKIRWYSQNSGKHYYTVAKCSEHGLMKGKIRIRKSKDDKYYAIKTVKNISEEEADLIISKKKTEAK